MIKGVHVGFSYGYIVGPATVHDRGNNLRVGFSIGELCVKSALALRLDTVKGKNRIARQEAGVCCWTAPSHLDYLNAVCTINGSDYSQCPVKRYCFKGCLSYLACWVTWSRMI